MCKFRFHDRHSPIRDGNVDSFTFIISRFVASLLSAAIAAIVIAIRRSPDICQQLFLALLRSLYHVQIRHMIQFDVRQSYQHVDSLALIISHCIVTSTIFSYLHQNWSSVKNPQLHPNVFVSKTSCSLICPAMARYSLSLI